MKAKHALAIIICGYCLEVIGALIKIMHWPGANLILIVATMLIVVGFLLFLVKLIRYEKFKEFLES